ncbi:MAG: hypothetical protein K9M15_02460 [Candidatus Marinimicrobia bacterium]|nr:hypothetical protein [Candidatus Neomarinimicrobiota bacterium]
MRHNKMIMVLGVWLVALAFLNFSKTFTTILLVLTGIWIVFLAIRKTPVVKTDKEFVKHFKEKEESFLKSEQESKDDKAEINTDRATQTSDVD